MWKIDKGVPVPKRGHRLEKAPLLDMAVGDSFFVPKNDEDGDTFRGRMYGKAKTAGIRVTIRRVEEGGVDGHRVWRIE